MTAPIEPGAMAFLLRDSKDLFNGYERRRGFEFEVEEFVPAFPEHEGDPDYIQVDYYEGHTSSGWSNVCLAAEDVALLRTKEEMNNRALPSVADLVEWLGDSLGDFKDDGSISEADLNKDEGEIEFAGVTPEGLPFAFSVKILNVYEADL